MMLGLKRVAVLAAVGLAAWVDAHAEEWVTVSADQAHQVQVDSLRSAWPWVSYRFRFGGPGARGDIYAVEVNCRTRLRRNSPEGSPLGMPYAVDDWSLGYRQEVDFVCRWGREQAVGPSPAPAPAAQPDPSGRAEAVPRAAPERAPEARLSSGSGFVVAQGRVVTNHHVVNRCTNVSVRLGDRVVPVKVAAATSRNDLALLISPEPIGNPVAVRTSAALGEEVTVAGHPLAGLLSNDLVVTSGQVSSLAGPANDPTLLQVSAPVQPGNSGGPLLDRSGSVVGVVVSKLDVQRLARVTGDIAQNVNFAIKPEVLRLFLDTNRVPYRTAAIGQGLDGIQLAEKARQFTVQVVCEK